MHLGHVAEEIQHRLQHIFVRGDDGRRAVNDGNDLFDYDEHWQDYIWFYEFFDADTGRGLGASHQCGWTGLIAKMIQDTGYVGNRIRMYMMITYGAVASTADSRRPLGRQQQLQLTTLTMCFLAPRRLAKSSHGFVGRQPRVPLAIGAASMARSTAITNITPMTVRTTGRDERAKRMITSPDMSRKLWKGCVRRGMLPTTKPNWRLQSMISKPDGLELSLEDA